MSKKTLKQKYEQLRTPKPFSSSDLDVYEKFHWAKALRYVDKDNIGRAFMYLERREKDFRPKAYEFMTNQLHLIDAVAPY